MTLFRIALQGMRQSYAENRSRQASAELPTANGKHATSLVHPQAQHAKQHEPPRISADHQFLSDDENSSGSDEEHAGGITDAKKQQHRPHPRSNGAVSQPSAAAPAPAQQPAEQPQQPAAAASSAAQVCFRLSLLCFSQIWGCCRCLSRDFPECPLCYVAIGRHENVDMLSHF